MGQLIQEPPLLLQGQLLGRQIPRQEQQVAITGLGNAAPLQLQQLLTHAIGALTITAAEPAAADAQPPRSPSERHYC